VDIDDRDEQEDLGRHIERHGRMKLGAVLEAFGGVAEVLDQMHQRGEVLGDLQPASLLVRGDGSVEIHDAGPHRPPGDPAYLAPERFDRGEPSPAADLYALGAVLYHALTGRPPIEGGGQAEVLANLLLHGARRADEVDPAVPAHAADALAAAMARDPVGRFTSAGQLMRALRGEEQVTPSPGRRSVAAKKSGRSRGTPLQWLGFLAAVGLLTCIVLLQLSKLRRPPAEDDGPLAVEPVRGGTLRVGTTSSISGLDPVTLGASGQADLLPLLYDTLVEVDQAGDPVPSLARTWEVYSRYTRYVFHVREGVAFHPDPCLPEQRHELDAGDVRGSLERVLVHIARDPDSAWQTLPAVEGTAALLAGEAEQLAGVQALDAYTVEVRFLDPAPTFLQCLTWAQWSMVAEEALATYGPEDMGLHVVGTGPYRLEHAEAGSTLTLERFADGWHRDAVGRPLPYLDRMELRAYGDSATARAALGEGEIDLLLGASRGTDDLTPRSLRELWLEPAAP
jgi:Bacterial extracellular solute-binding proteins, family 5 Middle/Protein kinase domain